MSCEVKRKGKRRKCGQPMAVMYRIVEGLRSTVPHEREFDVCEECWKFYNRQALVEALLRGAKNGNA